jgi:surface antigen
MLLAPVPGAAQYGLFYAPKLSEKDVALMRSAAREGMDGKPVGSVVEWMNPDTGARGHARLLRRFEGPNGECREVEQFADAPGPSEPWRSQGVLCLDETGTWRVLPDRPEEPTVE